MSTTTAIVKATTTRPLCGCGCGTPVLKAKSLYRPGHDARHAGLIAREAVHSAFPERMITDHLPTPALRAKATAMVNRLHERAASKATRVSSTVSGTVKIGRWVYPARKLVGGQVVRNTKRDGSGEWVQISNVEFAA